MSSWEGHALKSELPLYAPGRPKRELKHKFPQSSYKSSYKGDIVPRGSHLKVQVSPIHSQEAKPHTNTQVRDKSSTKGNEKPPFTPSSHFVRPHSQAVTEGTTARRHGTLISRDPVRDANKNVPIRYRGCFDSIPGDEIKMQMQSYAMQPCKLYFR